MSEFEKVINEMLSGVVIPTGNDSPKETLVNPANDDFYARGDSRNVVGRKPRKKKRNKRVPHSRKRTRKRKPLQEMAGKVIHKKMSEEHPELRRKILFETGFNMAYMENRFECLERISNRVLNPTRKVNNRYQNRPINKPLKKHVFEDIDWKRLKREIDLHLGDDVYFICASINEDKDTITFKYEFI